MLKTSALAIMVAVGFCGIAAAQTFRPPMLPDAASGQAVLVKHDKDGEGHGRKLGHFKNRGRDDDEDDHEDSARRSSTRASRRSTAPSWTNPAPYYMPPSYGNSYPTAPYGYPQPPYYYRGY